MKETLHFPVDPKPVPCGNPTHQASRWRWVVYLTFLGCYPLVLGVLGHWVRQGGEDGPTFSDSATLMQATLLEMFIFAGVVGLGWLATRVTADQLLLKWRRGFLPLPLGVVYSIGLRIVLGVVVMAGLKGYTAVSGADFQEAAAAMRPEVGTLVDFESLQSDPLYLWLNLTWVSFVVAGFREELWRAALLAGLAGLFPRIYARPAGKGAAVLIAACVFGLGHLPMGWGAVFMTGILGLGLGVIMVVHRSIWEAVLAHGFFNASTFLMLHLLQKYFPELLEGLGVWHGIPSALGG